MPLRAVAIACAVLPATLVAWSAEQSGAEVVEANCRLPDFEASLLARANAHRARGASCGAKGRFGPAGPLGWNDALQAAALGHSQDMVARDFFSHTSSSGNTLPKRAETAGYAWRALGENIAAGPRTVEAVVDGWMASPGHCANIMNATFTEMGVACLPGGPRNGYATYWTMDLGAPRR